MSYLRQGLSAFLGLVLVVVLVYVAVTVLRGLGGILQSLDSSVAAAIIAAVVSVISIALAKGYESVLLIQKEHRERKIPVYEELLKFMSRAMMAEKLGDTLDESEVRAFMLDFNQRFMVWGSDDVLAAWVRWRRAAVREGTADPVELILLYEQLILAIRRDLGHKNKNIKQRDILALFINDIDNALDNQPRELRR